MEPLLKYVQDNFIEKKEFPEFSAGDTITVYYEIKEGDKKRTQFFKGVVIQRKGHGVTATFTIRKMSGTSITLEDLQVKKPVLKKFAKRKLMNNIKAKSKVCLSLCFFSFTNE